MIYRMTNINSKRIIYYSYLPVDVSNVMTVSDDNDDTPVIHDRSEFIGKE